MALTCNVNIDVKNNQQQAPIQSVNYVSVASSWSCSTNLTKKGYANLRTFYKFTYILRKFTYILRMFNVVRITRTKLRRANKERPKTRYCRTKSFYKYWYESRRSRCVNVSNFRLLLCWIFFLSDSPLYFSSRVLWFVRNSIFGLSVTSFSSTGTIRSVSEIEGAAKLSL